MDAEQSAARREKEAHALATLRQTTMSTVSDLAGLHAFLFVEHAAYRARSPDEHAAHEQQRAQGALASTY